MLSIEESYSIIEQLLPHDRVEQLPLSSCLGRILAQDVFADIDQPSFNKSAMDGYACRKEDLHAPLHVKGVIAAGTCINESLSSGDCYRIFTGAPVPEGANCVIKQEDTELSDNGNVIFTGSKSNDNICFQGEDCKIGEKVLTAGTVIGPQHLASLAGYGVNNPLVFQKASVVLICSGSELVEPTVKPSGPMIRNSNATQLLGQLTAIGAHVEYKGIVCDDREEIHDSIKSNINLYDFVIITGGASVGDFDFIPSVLTSLGAEIQISSLNIQPGKPLLLGKIDKTFIIGLSGNPVSSFLQTKLIVQPLILKKMGAKLFLPKIIQIPLHDDVSRKKGDRKLFLPAKINADGKAEVIKFNGSAHLLSLTSADGFIILNPGVNLIMKNELVQLVLFGA
jgi:molybdopterin molybdotransferase